MNTNMREVTTLSKTIAMILFIALPFIGGWVGYHYAPVKVVEIEKIVTVEPTGVSPQEETDDIVAGTPPTERYVGTIGGEDMMFEHTNYTSYRLVQGGVVSTGALNTERGYADDIDATVFILDWQSPAEQQRLLVRLTGESELHPLDQQRNIIGTDALVRMNDPVTFSCLSGASITASFAPRAVYLELSDGRSAIVPQTISASGARYANMDESFVFWNKGDTAFIEENGIVSYGECATGE